MHLHKVADFIVKQCHASIVVVSQRRPVCTGWEVLQEQLDPDLTQMNAAGFERFEKSGRQPNRQHVPIPEARLPTDSHLKKSRRDIVCTVLNA